MDTFTSDQNYLRRQQYGTADKLAVRMALHERFSTNREDWFEWVFDHLFLQPGMRILEVGCGTGQLWVNNLQRIPAGCTINLVDLSTGMAAHSCRALQDAPHFSFASADAQHLPFPAQHFDAIIANHMLFHVPDLSAAAIELERVLHLDGKLFATTNGREHMSDMYRLIREVHPDYPPHSPGAARFGLENAADCLSAAFSRSEVFIFPNELWINEAQPLLDTIETLWGFDSGSFTLNRPAMQALIEQRIQRDGGIRIRKSSGIVCASR